jgi:hypothetical protein
MAVRAPHCGAWARLLRQRPGLLARRLYILRSLVPHPKRKAPSGQVGSLSAGDRLAVNFSITNCLARPAKPVDVRKPLMDWKCCP